MEVGLKSVGIMPDHMEGYRANSWVLMDYNSVIVHIFTPESREFYDLDRLWQDGESIDMSFFKLGKFCEVRTSTIRRKMA